MAYAYCLAVVFGHGNNAGGIKYEIITATVAESDRRRYCCPLHSSGQSGVTASFFKKGGSKTVKPIMICLPAIFFSARLRPSECKNPDFAGLYQCFLHPNMGTPFVKIRCAERGISAFFIKSGCLFLRMNDYFSIGSRCDLLFGIFEHSGSDMLFSIFRQYRDAAEQHC